jgi:predicted DNA-binding transcriptional regulator YafY
MNASRLSRCLRLLNLLQARVGHTVDELARECGVSKRTIYRDLRLLAEAGVHLHYDAEAGGHVALPQFSSTIIQGLTREELTTFILAARTSCLRPIDTIRSSVNHSISKMLARIPTREREEIIRLLKSCVVELPHSNSDQHIVLSILSAIRQNQQIRITFTPNPDNGQLLQTKIAPYRLVVSTKGWEVVARSSLHRQICCFSLSQIHAVETTEDTFRRLPLRFRHNRHASNVLIQHGSINRGRDALSPTLGATLTSPVPNRQRCHSK